MRAEPILRCDHLVRFYDTPSGRVQAVRGVDIELPAGVTAAVVGPSGSGKSSLLRMLAGLDRPTAGTVLVGGVDLWQLTERARARRRAHLLTHVYQRPSDNLFAHLTARMQLRRLVRGSGDGVVGEWLERLGLSHRADHTPDDMSGGERQRLAFARAAVAGHQLVIADEPTSQLDSVSARGVMDAVAALSSAGVTVLFATHDRRVLEHVDQVIALRDGAVATVTSAGSELAVIDRSGRLQLPPELQERFPDRRVRLVWDEDDDHVRLEEP
ncbi:MAG: ATP-binding cassette domain-containing protein [Ilumatobacter sp.]|uniref:ABC transporter ATP-binding protein n=1 Tax=Ilumatobacter sp. TaxID=1967498 RepID=UPI0026051968|nr:ATP-binding cassette domain-containing protein [Ilumatobacter sp.]MDJ0770175.1 ATP-binding cassette domain-containing protein [Ilumatobacter sp.]